MTTLELLALALRGKPAGPVVMNGDESAPLWWDGETVGPEVPYDPFARSEREVQADAAQAMIAGLDESHLRRIIGAGHVVG